MEKNKIIVGIDIDEILRNTWVQFDRYYYNEFGEEGIPEESYVFDFFNTYKWDDKIETIKILKDDAPDDISPLDYVVDENGECNADHVLFYNETKEYSAVDVYNKFMYDDYLFEIFGTAPPMYSNLISDLKKLISKTPECEYVVFSKHKQITIAPTLFFLSKIGSSFKIYKFCSSNEEIWNECDIVFTTNPDLIKDKPLNKTLVKFKRPYNMEYESEFEILQIADLFNDDNLNKILKIYGDK